MKFAKFENRNVKGVSVNNQPFLTLWDAEVYCDEEGIDPDIISDDLGIVKKLVDERFPELEFVKTMLMKQMNAIEDELYAIADRITSYEEKHDILSVVSAKVAKDEQNRLIGEFSGVQKFYSQLCNRTFDFYSIRNMSVNGR